MKKDPFEAAVSFQKKPDQGPTEPLPKNEAVENFGETGDIVAVLICSYVLEAEIWFALRDDWKPSKGEKRATFYAHELPFLRTKTPEQLREIHKTKLAFPGARVIQEGPR